jgi:methyl-accepting chemotaxis protein
VQRSQALTHTLFYGLAGTSFVLLLILLNLLISRIVIAPVRNVQQAMSRAATGDLEARLPVHSRDELGAMADAFNRMVGEILTSKREVEEYSHNLETMVAVRTWLRSRPTFDLKPAGRSRQRGDRRRLPGRAGADRDSTARVRSRGFGDVRAGARRGAGR